MATVSCGRGALAMALVGAFASPAPSTEWKAGIVVDRGEAAQLDPGDIVHVSGDKVVGIRVATRATFDAEALNLIHDGATAPTGHAFGILAIDGAEVSLANSRIQLNGRRTIGVQAQRHATIELDRSSVEVSSSAGDRSIALALSGGTALMSM